MKSVENTNTINYRCEFIEGVEFEILNPEIGDKKYDVLVFCLAYNEDLFIEKTLQGFLSQKTYCSFVILVFDDASTDMTPSILTRYSEMHPSKIMVALAKINTYGTLKRKKIKNSLLRRIDTKYIALCEGDDYWIYDKKLQRQYDFMEAHNEYAMCVHNAIRYNISEDELTLQLLDKQDGLIDDKELFLCIEGRIPTASFFYKKQYDNSNSDEYFFSLSPVGDDPLRYWCGYNGGVYYMDKVWAVRTFMRKGSWNSKMSDSSFSHEYRLKYNLFLKAFNERTNGQYYVFIRTIIYNNCFAELPEINHNFTVEEYRQRIKQIKIDTNNEFDEEYDYIFYENVIRCSDYLDTIESEMKKYKSVYIYGAGVEARKIAELLGKEVDFDGFLVSPHKENPTIYMKKQVFVFSELLIERNETGIILGLNSNNRKEVLRFLWDKGYRNLY